MEGLIEGVTGWAIGDEKRQREDESSGLRDAASLYDKLERVIMPMFHNYRDRYVEVMRHRGERLLLQHANNAAAICVKRIFPLRQRPCSMITRR